MSSQPPMGGHFAIPIIYKLTSYEQPPALKGHFYCVTRVAAHSRFYCIANGQCFFCFWLFIACLNMLKQHIYKILLLTSINWMIMIFCRNEDVFRDSVNLETVYKVTCRFKLSLSTSIFPQLKLLLLFKTPFNPCASELFFS